MVKEYIERIADAGIVGAGGAGFPTHIKLNHPAELIIANGTECEPLLRVDQQLMETFPEKIIAGLRIAMKITGSAKGVICLKEKYRRAQEKLAEVIDGSDSISLYLTGNYYPAGDEQQIIYEITGKAIPIGGLPQDAGVIVNNVHTLINLNEALNNNIPVTNRFLTVAGAVKTPLTLNVPIGTPIKKIIKIAGGPDPDQGYTAVLGGPVMGKVAEDWMTPVTKTLGGIIVLPSDHPLIQKKTASIEKEYRYTKSLCCQCNFCTQMCPRNALGLGVEPHKVMRAVGYGESPAIGNVNRIFGCCDCGLCTYYACNMGLSPGRMVTLVKNGLLKKGVQPIKELPGVVNSSREYQKVPANRLIQRLGLSEYNVEAPFRPEPVEVTEVKIPLKQHIGSPSLPVVQPGDKVQKGDLIGKTDRKIGAKLHASISGVVTGVSGEYIAIRTP